MNGNQSADPHDDVARLEERIEELASKIESCSKLILASRVAVACGTLLLAAMLFGAIRFDPAIMAAAVAASLGGTAVWGSNGSTAKEAAKDLAAAEVARLALIEMMDLSDIPPVRGFGLGSQTLRRRDRTAPSGVVS